MDSYQNLQKNFGHLESQIQRRREDRRVKAEKRKEELAELLETYEEKNNTIISKIEELKRKQTLLITLKRIQPEIPEGFPKNYFCQLVYEDTVLNGTHKFTDFDQNVIQQKFVLPLLFSSIVKVQVWTAEQQPTLWAKSQINLQKDIQIALISQMCDGQLSIAQQSAHILYRLQLQGIGFSTWLKNIIQIRQLQVQKAYSRQQGQYKKQQARMKAQQKKQKFKAKFQRNGKAQTHQYKANNVEQILEQLEAD